MRESLQIAKQELIERWIKAFDEIDQFSFYEAKTVKIRYAESYRFDVSAYKYGKIKAGGKLLDEKKNDKIDYHEYGLDKNNFPTISRAKHSWNKIDWIGFYKKEDNLVEYVEFCVNTSVPSVIERIILNNGKKLFFQSFRINGRGTGFHKSYLTLPREEMIKNIITDNSSVNLVIEEYEYEKNNIKQAFCCGIASGYGQYTCIDLYNYYDSGYLKEIKTIYKNGFPNRIKYFKSEKNTFLKNLSISLTQKIANRIIEVLLAMAFESPLFCLQLSYRSVSNYWPSLIPVTLKFKNWVKDEEGPFMAQPGDFISVNDENIEEEFTEFCRMIDEKESWNAASNMLRNVARILTLSKLDNKIKVTNDFVAFAVDMELEGRELDKIIIKCGADKASVKQWKKLGWI